MPPPLAYLITWTTYGSWLPGDKRGWVDSADEGIQHGDPERFESAQHQLLESAVRLTDDQRRIVESAIVEHCQYRGWTLRAVNVRTNHVHLVVTADADPDDVAGKIKARCSRVLNDGPDGRREHWWTRDQSTKWINDESYLKNAIRYVLQGQ